MSDAEALARYYNNLGVEAMVRQESGQAFDYLQAAIEKIKNMPMPGLIWGFGIRRSSAGWMLSRLI